MHHWSSHTVLHQQSVVGSKNTRELVGVSSARQSVATTTSACFWTTSKSACNQFPTTGYGRPLDRSAKKVELCCNLELSDDVSIT